MQFSYQLYSSRNFGPLDATMKMIADAGYKQAEPFGGLLEDADALCRAAEAHGIAMPTGHVNLAMLEGDSVAAIAIAKQCGMHTVFAPYLMPDDRPDTPEGWHDFGKRLGEAAKPVRDAGLAFGWHNHDFEFRPVEGQTPMELILEGGGDALGVELDVAWVVKGGGDPVSFMQKHASRILAAHIKDIAPDGEATDEDGWADVGHGTLDWAGLYAALQKTGARVFVMEHDNPADDTRFAKRSIDFMQKIGGGA